MLHASKGEAAAISVAEPQYAERVFSASSPSPSPRTRQTGGCTQSPGSISGISRRSLRALGGTALPLRTALVDQDYCAVALWLPPGAGPDDQALTDLIEVSMTPEKKEVMAAVIDEMVRYHPQEPHWYLPFIGVDPARQGNGLGAALLRPVLAQCDAARLPAYLELTNPRNRPLYERHGFHATGEIRVGGCPVIVPMLREPKP